MTDSKLIPTATISYKGELRTEAIHVKSGTKIFTDAPVDNHGKGESFSPTDLLATAYVSCMLSIIGIHCQNNAINFIHGEGSVVKIMGENPRKIAQLKIEIDCSGNGWDKDIQERMERLAMNCPVAKSIDEYVEVDVNFTF